MSGQGVNPVDPAMAETNDNSVPLQGVDSLSIDPRSI